MTGRLRGRTALVTGASSGVGHAVAILLASEACRVLCTARRQERLAALEERFPGQMACVAADLSHGGSTDTILERAPAGFRTIDLLVNCAGHDLGGRTPFHQSDRCDWESVIDVNLIGLMRVTRVVLPGMLERDRGDIVNITSTAIHHPAPTLAAYKASKDGVHGFTQALRAECALTGVRVIEVAPGPIATEFAQKRWRDDKEQAAEFYAGLPEILAPEDVANAVLFAVSQPPSVTIADIVVQPTRMR